MRKNKLGIIGLLAGGLIAGVGITATQGCDAADGVCGPCGTIASGQLSIAGNAQLDGFFAAVAQLQNATVKINGDFAADIKGLASFYPEANLSGEVNGAFIDGLIAAIKADISANASGGLQIVYKAPECRANIDVSVKAQANCEVEAKCDVKVDPGEVSVKCEGGCSGGCSGTCSGDFSCEVKAPAVKCEGMCEGTCDLDAAAGCDGTCRGDCDGECSVRDAEGKCAGSCSGNCSGSCELSAKAECKGTCSGKCFVEQGSAQCTGDVSCSGSCDAECSGSCSGKATPPSASADCDASADCSAQAEAQGSASLECTPPRLDIEFAFSGDAKARGAFLARMGELRLRGVAILQGAAKMSALVTGEVDGQVVFEVSPLLAVTQSMQGIVSAGVSGDLNIAAGRLPCVIPALQEAIKVLGGIGTSVGGTIEAQAKFGTFLTTGGK